MTVADVKQEFAYDRWASQIASDQAIARTLARAEALAHQREDQVLAYRVLVKRVVKKLELLSHDTEDTLVALYEDANAAVMAAWHTADIYQRQRGRIPNAFWPWCELYLADDYARYQLVERDLAVKPVTRDTITAWQHAFIALIEAFAPHDADVEDALRTSESTRVG